MKTNIESLPDKLSYQEEIELLKRSVNGCEESRCRLVESTLKDATKLVASITNNTFGMAEAMSIAGAALMRAVRNYRFFGSAKNPTRFFTYARPYLRGEITAAWKLRCPVSYGRHGPPEKVVQEDIPIETIPDNFDDTDESGPNYDLIHIHERWEMVKPHLNKLSETERRILTLQFFSGLDGVQIGNMLGCTRANVREARNRALKKIRHALIREGKYNVNE